MSDKQFMPELEKLAPADAKRALDLKAQEMKNAVICTPNYQPKGERVIYVSNSGCDCNDGLSMEKPIRTLAKVQEITQPGDTILFKRGDHFRGNIQVDKDGVTYASYGEGVKPIIDSSARNYADPALWQETDAPNVYVCTEELNNVGLIHFDPEYTYGQYNELYGHMKLRHEDGFGYKNLTGDLDFFSDRETNKLYLYSEKGNPGERFVDIEIGAAGNTFGGWAHNVTFDGLWIMHTGCHGIGSGTTVNRVVRNCVFSWLGGSMLGGARRADGSYNTTRFGNAVEIYGGCEGYTVENNWMYQIYDTAVTHQYGHYSEGDCIQHDVLYRDNLMEYCFWFIEFYDGERPGTKRNIKNVYMTNNFCRMGGYGWGCKGREGGAPMFCGSHVCEDITNFVAERNVFYQSLGFLVRFENDPGVKKIVVRNNVYVNPKGAKFAHLYDQDYRFDDSAKETLKLINEEEPTIVFMPAPEVRF
ncbi:MAG: hypothetical protein IJ493_00895 [Clostridia bacterium]|nr:hypothetical protein [Clostridia bacterium]